MSLTQEITASKDLAEALSYWATALGIALAIIAGVTALVRYFLDRRYDEWRTADTHYGAFLDCALAFPQFYGGSWSTSKTKDLAFRNGYMYFVGKFLWTCEQIILGERYDLEWRDCLKIIMKEHADYLRSDSFAQEKPGYDRRIVAMIDEAVAEEDRKSGQDNNNA